MDDVKRTYRAHALIAVDVDVRAEDRAEARKKALAFNVEVHGDYEGRAATMPVRVDVERREETEE